LQPMRFVSLVGFLALSAGLVHATDISGTISSTLVITKNSQLIGNATCTVTGSPCIQFGAPNIKLSLNGHVLTGKGSALQCLSVASGEDGIDTNFQNGVMIAGPGLIRRFRDAGILITGNNIGVDHVSVVDSCEEGIRVLGHGNHVENNSVVRSALAGGLLAGILCGGTGGHSIQRNEVIASGVGGLILVAAPQGGPIAGGSGILIYSNGNVIDTNDVSGNSGFGIGVNSSVPAGINNSLAPNPAAATGNVISNNSVIGNFVVALGNPIRDTLTGTDFIDGSLPGSNTYINNACEGSFGAGAPVCPNLPAVSGHATPVN